MRAASPAFRRLGGEPSSFRPPSPLLVAVAVVVAATVVPVAGCSLILLEGAMSSESQSCPASCGLDNFPCCSMPVSSRRARRRLARVSAPCCQRLLLLALFLISLALSCCWQPISYSSLVCPY